MIRLTVFSFSLASALWFAPLASRWCVLSASELTNSGGLITGFLWPPAFRVLCRGFFFSPGPNDWSGLWSRLWSVGMNVDLSTSSCTENTIWFKDSENKCWGVETSQVCIDPSDILLISRENVFDSSLKKQARIIFTVTNLQLKSSGLNTTD